MIITSKKVYDHCSIFHLSRGSQQGVILPSGDLFQLGDIILVVINWGKGAAGIYW